MLTALKRVEKFLILSLMVMKKSAAIAPTPDGTQPPAQK